MTLALNDRVKETTTVTGTGTAALLGATTGFQSFAVIGNANTTYYCIADQGGANWEVGIGTYTASGTTLARTTVLASSNAGALVVFTTGVKDVFVTYPSEKGLWKDATGNAIGLGTPAAFVGTNITGTASGLTAGNVTTNANLTGAVTSSGNATSLGSFTSLQLATALTDETGTGSAVFSDNASLLNPTYTGTLTGSTAILNIGSGQVYKDASGNVGIGTSSPSVKLDVIGTQWLRGANSTGAVAVINADATSGANGISLSASFVTGSYGPIVFNTSNAERMRIDSSGNLLVGTTSSSPSNSNSIYFYPSLGVGVFQHINGTASGNPYIGCKYNGVDVGSIAQNGTTGVLYNLTSDYRLKNNPTALTGASEFIKALQPKTWDWWDGSGKGVGFIAHEFMEVAKYSGNGTKDEVDAEGEPVMQSIQPSSSEVMANIVAFIQEQQTLIEALTARLTKAGL